MLPKNCIFHLEEDGSFNVTETVMSTFHEYGFIYVKSLLSSSELEKISKAIDENQWILKTYRRNDDGQGRTAKLTIWNQIGDDLTGALASCEKVAGTMEHLLGGEVYHYHTKLSMKDALTGGSFVWHQDYGYWYNNGCLRPNMGTVFMAMDDCKPENGCLKIIPKSHHCGRINHIKVGGQIGADLERIRQIENHLEPVVEVIMNPGDALFFHCNLLHTSGPNSSPNRRFAYLVSFNRADNNPVYVHHHPQYSPLKKLPNTAILDAPTIITMDDKAIMTPEAQDFSVLKVAEIN